MRQTTYREDRHGNPVIGDRRIAAVVVQWDTGEEEVVPFAECEQEAAREFYRFAKPHWPRHPARKISLITFGPDRTAELDAARKRREAAEAAAREQERQWARFMAERGA